jgi:hypothetical protein
MDGDAPESNVVGSEDVVVVVTSEGRPEPLTDCVSKRSTVGISGAISKFIPSVVSTGATLVSIATAPLASNSSPVSSPASPFLATKGSVLFTTPGNTAGAGAGGGALAAAAASRAASPMPTSPLATIQSTKRHTPNSRLDASPAGTRSIAASSVLASGKGAVELFLETPACLMNTRGRSAPFGYAPFAIVIVTKTFL